MEHLDGEFGASTEHIEFISFIVKTDPLAPAGLNQPISVRVEHPYSGQLIGDVHVFYVVVGQIFNGSSTPTNQSLDLDIGESTFTTIKVVNTVMHPQTTQFGSTILKPVMLNSS